MQRYARTLTELVENNTIWHDAQNRIDCVTQFLRSIFLLNCVFFFFCVYTIKVPQLFAYTNQPVYAFLTTFCLSLQFLVPFSLITSRVNGKITSYKCVIQSRNSCVILYYSFSKTNTILEKQWCGMHKFYGRKRYNSVKQNEYKYVSDFYLFRALIFGERIQK